MPKDQRGQPMDPFAPTPQRRGENSDPDDERFARASRDATVRAQLKARAAQLTESHWVTHVCPRGHVTEVHRMTGGTQVMTRCPICGAESAREAPDATAIREHQLFMRPLALLQRAADALLEWGQRHLDAQTWTARSEMQRKADLIAGTDRFDQRPRHFDNPFPR